MTAEHEISTDLTSLPPEREKRTRSLIPSDVWAEYQREITSLEDDARPHESGRSNLLTQIAPTSLTALEKSAHREVVKAGEHLFIENDPAESFWVILEGQIEVYRWFEDKELVIHQLGPGETVGVLAMFCGPNQTACARATKRTVVLEVPAQKLHQLILRDVELHRYLFGIYQTRLVQTFVGGSRVFGTLEADVRTELSSKFTNRQLSKGESLVEPGVVTHMMAVVASGQLLLEVREPRGAPSKLYHLDSGQYVSVLGALNGAPSQVRITSAEESTVSLLTHRTFLKFATQHNELRTIADHLKTLGREVVKNVFCGPATGP